jgi:hypothetical protein
MARTEHMEIRKRWGFAEKHLNDLSNFKNENLFTFLNKFDSDDDKYIFSGNLRELDDIIQLSDNILHSKTADKHICESLLTYSWLSVFRVFIDSASNLDDDIYFNADRYFYKKRMIQLLTTFLEMETKNKSHLDISILQVQHNSFKHRQVEKKLITDTLKELNTDNRQLMSQLYRNGLGIWREGEFDHVKYDPKAYDRNGIPTDVLDYNQYIDLKCNDENGYDSGDNDGNNDYDD